MSTEYSEGGASPAEAEAIDAVFLAKVAVYASDEDPPVIHEVAAPQPLLLLDRLTEMVIEFSRDLGGGLPATAVERVVENLLHADLKDVTVTIARGGNLLRVADRGPGIPDKERAFRLGFTTADGDLRRVIDGVGAGLALARRSLEEVDGTLVLEDNLAGGTVVTLEVPAAPTEERASSPHPVRLTERQTTTLLMVLELNPVGPTALAEELALSPATAYRELVRLEELGLVNSDSAGLRTVTQEGLEQIQSLL